MKKIGCVGVLLLCLLLGACAALGGKSTCAEGHSFTISEVMKRPGCSTVGEKVLFCENCDATQTQEIPATGNHRLKNYVVDRPATVFEAGQRSRYCERCHLAAESVEISALHSSVKVEKTQETQTWEPESCTVLYDDAEWSVFYLESVNRFCALLEQYAGVEVMAVPLDEQGEHDGLEILIGCGTDTQTAAARALVAGNGFAVAAVDGKLLIAGTDALQAMRAIQYVSYEYLLGKTGNTLTVAKQAVASNVPLTVLADAEKSEFELVFSARLDNDKAHPYVQTDSSSDSRDYPCKATEQLAAELAAQMMLPADTFAVRDDKTWGEYEILIGTLPDRPESESFRLTLAADEYGILVQDGRIILTAHNDLVLAECLAQFRELLVLAERYGEGTGTSWCFPEGFCAVARMESNWITEFPQPTGEGILLYNTQYNNDDSLQHYYTGEGVSADAYRAYCDRLVAAGYTLLAENSIEDSLFKTFVNEREGITLYVAYNDYKHAADYVEDDAYHVDFQKCIRVISAPLGSVTLPDAGLLNADPAYEKVTDSTITQLPFTGKAVGMGYVILLEDGRFVVIDGGGVNSDGREHEQLFEVLAAQFKRTFGKSPSASDPIRIAAWINTHSHWDHYYAFRQMLKKHGPTGEVTLEYLIGNFPEESSIYPVSGSSLAMGEAATILAMQAHVQGGFRYVKVHTGHKLYLANLTMEILMTYEDHNPRRICNSNDTCTIVRMSLANADAPDAAAPVTALFLADAFRFQSRFLCAMYGEYLRSDIVQLAHHGNIGCEKAVYETIAPTVVFFPNDYDSYASYTQGNSSKWNYQVDRYVVNTLESVRYIYVAHRVFLTLTLDASGPAYDAIFDAITQQALDYNGLSIRDKSMG